VVARRTLGRTAHSLYPLGLGGHTYPIGESPDDFATPDERATLVQTLIDAGVNYIDTTWLNEVQAVADALRRTGTTRDQVVISLQYVDGMSDPTWRTKLRAEIETRLHTLDYSSAPLFLMGVGNAPVPYAEMVAACQAMDNLRSEGLIHHIGVSCHQIDHYPRLARLIRECDLVDYVLIRFNWKFRQAQEELFPTAHAHNVGLVLMKVFCWDCGPGQWGRRISVFEPLTDKERGHDMHVLTPAQRSLIWCLQQVPDAVVVPATNSLWEAGQNLHALDHLEATVDTSDFDEYAKRLWSQDELHALSERAESSTIRERARKLLD